MAINNFIRGATTSLSMAFQISSSMNGQSSENNGSSLSSIQQNMDSISLGQLKAMVGSVPKPKARVFYGASRLTALLILCFFVFCSNGGTTIITTMKIRL